MPKVEFESLPDSARVWVFGAESPVVGNASNDLLAAVDQHLSSWRAHGVPLVCARDWYENQFLAVAVDEAATGASGCSIDGDVSSTCRSRGRGWNHARGRGKDFLA